MSLPAVSTPRLVRAVGRWDLVALVTNGIVGAGIFGLPAKVHALIGAWGILAIVACAVLTLLIILCFAEVSSRFTETGGPFLYATEAFGPFAGFIAGWLLWLARIAGICAIIGIMVQYLAFVIPSVASGMSRVVLLTCVIFGFAALHVSGIRRAIRFSNVVTIAKLVPLVLLVALGVPAIRWQSLDFSTTPSTPDFSSAMLLLVFAFVGWETALVAAGELRDPRRDMPFALLVALAVVALLYVGLQAVCVGMLPMLGASTRPLADAALALVGPIGGTVIVVGAVISMLGTINGGMLTISRIPFAMAEAGALPAPFAALHPLFRTPVLCIALSTAIVWLLTLTNSHIYLLTISTIARLLVFAMTCAALPVLRRRTATLPARFTLAGGLTIPIAAMALVAWLLANTSRAETRDVLLAATAGAVIYALLRLRKTR